MNIHNQHVAGLGIMLHNRRRNKVSGKVIFIESKELSDEMFSLLFVIETTQNMGNCPKYITVRDVQYFHRPIKKVVYHELETTLELPQDCIDLISSSDCTFLATCHFDLENTDVGVNHRNWIFNA